MEKQQNNFMEVHGPDGTVFEFPQDASEAEILATFEQAPGLVNASTQSMQPDTQPMPSKPDTPWYEQAANYAGGAARRFQDGVFMGFADELHGGVTALPRAAYNAYQGEGFDVGQAYEQGRDDWRNASKGFQSDNPVTGTALEIGGGVTSAAALPWATPAKGAGLTAKTMTGIKTGGSMGAVYGAGNAEGDLTDRLIGAGQGAGIGALTGGLAVPAIEAGSKAARLIANQTINRLPGRADNAALLKVAEALQRDGLQPAQAAARIAELGPESALMDVGPNSQALARAIYTQPGQGKTVIGDFLKTRQEGTRTVDKALQGGQINRVSQSIDDLIPGNAQETRQGVQAARQQFGNSYEAARVGDDLVDVQPVMASLDDEIARSKGGIKTALEKVRSYIVDDAGRPELTIDSLHQAKMAIDDLMSGEAKSSMGNVAKARIRSYQDTLVDAIESAGESGAKYREGRLGTAAAWRINDALDSGEAFMSKRAFANADEMADAVKNMRPEEMEAFRTGAAQAIKSKLGDMNTRTDATKRLMDIPNLEAKIKTAFGDADTFRRYIGNLESERAMFDSYGKIIGGSRTGEVMSEQADAAIDPGRIVQGLRQVFTPTSVVDPLRGVVNVAGGVKDRVTLPDPMAARIAEALTGQDMNAINRAMQGDNVGPAARRSLARLLMTGGAVAGGRTAPSSAGYLAEDETRPRRSLANALMAR